VLTWLADLGLSDAQVRKSVVGFPRLFTYSLENSLKPKEQWLLDLGLDKAQVMKAISRHPQICSYSLEANLQPLVQWLLDQGLDNSQVANVQICGLSLEANLKPKVRLLGARGLSQTDIARTLATCPQSLVHSLERMTYRIGVLEAAGLLTDASFRTAVKMTDEKFASRFG